MAQQNRDYEKYSRNCNENTLGTEEIMQRQQQNVVYSDNILTAPTVGGVVDDRLRKERDELIRKKEKMEKKEKKKKKKEKERGEDKRTPEMAPSLHQDDAAYDRPTKQERDEWNAEIQWREFLLVVRDMILSYEGIFE